MRLPLLILAAGFAAGPALAQHAEIHCKHFFYGYPTGTPPTNDLVIRDAYALSSNDETRFADWVAFRLTPQEVFGLNESGDFYRYFRADPWLDPAASIDPGSGNPFTGSGYQRGHLAPLASFVGLEVVAEVNYFSNVAPQRQALNAGPWGRLEEAVRALVLRRAERALRNRPAGHVRFPQPDDLAAVWVMAGPLYEREVDPLPNVDEPHVVPSGYWQVVLVQEGWEPEDAVAAAFLFDQETPAGESPLVYLTTVDEVEARSGLDLLRLLPDDVEGPLEAAADADEAEALLFPDE
ncbi:MAG TPA: DNA/RNA non-specific endonuclease [Rubricoccaceae bacterium]|nr:DNA/RNA non-specific endonuclease [Rubricoccaceae bacterium]